MSDKMNLLKTEFTITFIPGSDFQADFGIGAIRAMCEAVKIYLTNSHKNNKITIKEK